PQPSAARRAHPRAAQVAEGSLLHPQAQPAHGDCWRAFFAFARNRVSQIPESLRHLRSPALRSRRAAAGLQVLSQPPVEVGTLPRAASTLAPAANRIAWPRLN